MATVHLGDPFRASSNRMRHMHICVIGNSHISALKEGWERIRHDYPSHELTFFGANRSRLADLELRGKALVADKFLVRRQLKQTSGGKTKIRLNDYDLFVVYGLELYYRPLDPRLSEAVRSSVVADSLMSSLNFATVLKIRKASSRSIVVGPVPLSSQVKDVSLLYDFSFFDRIAKAVLEPLDVVFIPQPQETIAKGGHTKAEYSLGSVRLLGGSTREVSDHVHMNGEYGILWLRSFLDPLAAGRRRARCDKQKAPTLARRNRVPAAEPGHQSGAAPRRKRGLLMRLVRTVLAPIIRPVRRFLTSANPWRHTLVRRIKRR